jgi:hypothetical protein
MLPVPYDGHRGKWFRAANEVSNCSEHNLPLSRDNLHPPFFGGLFRGNWASQLWVDNGCHRLPTEVKKGFMSVFSLSLRLVCKRAASHSNLKFGKPTNLKDRGLTNLKGCKQINKMNIQILDEKSPEIKDFFRALDEMFDAIEKTIMQQKPALTGGVTWITGKYARHSISHPALYRNTETNE